MLGGKDVQLGVACRDVIGLCHHAGQKSKLFVAGLSFYYYILGALCTLYNRVQDTMHPFVRCDLFLVSIDRPDVAHVPRRMGFPSIHVAVIAHRNFAGDYMDYALHGYLSDDTENKHKDIVCHHCPYFCREYVDECIWAGGMMKNKT